MGPEESPHIAVINFAEFYASTFESLGLGGDFYDKIAAIRIRKNDAKIILNQAARMIWLADRIDDVAHARPAFQILFYLIAAELVAKIAYGFEGEGESRKHVRKFFCALCSTEGRQRLSNAFQHIGGAYMSIESAIDLLYDVRCDVAHRGLYYDFSLPTITRGIPLISGSRKGGPIAKISIGEIRRVVLEGAVLAAKQIVDTNASEKRSKIR
jgi:hypothetical protein